MTPSGPTPPDTSPRATGPTLAAADFQSLAETLSSLIALIRGDKLVYVNPAGCALLGYPRDWFLGRDFWEVVHPDDRAQARARGRARAAGIPQPRRVVERLLHADGRTIWMDYSIDVVVFEGEPATLCTGHDVTERLRMEEQLRRSGARLAEAQRIAHIGSWEWDVVANRIDWSTELFRIFGIDPRTFPVPLERYLELVHPDDQAMARTVIETALAEGNGFAFEHRIIRPDGVTRVIHGRGEVFRDAQGHPVRVAGTGQDITDRRRMEQDLQRSEERFRLAFTHAGIGKLIVAPDRRVLQANPAACRILGHSEAELLALDTYAITHPDDREAADALVGRLLAGTDEAAAADLRLLHRDGCTVWSHIAATVIRDADGQPLYFIAEFENLNEQRRADEALRESAERYRALVEHAPEAIMILDVEAGRFVDANEPAEKLFGYSRARLLSMGPLDFCPEHQAEGRRSCEVVEDEHRKVLEGGTSVFEFTHVDADGREMVCQTRLSRLPAAGRKLIRATMTDITELKQLQEKVRHAEKLAAVGVLAAGVAHEIGNPLMALSMAAQSLERRTPDEYTQAKLKLIREHIDRIARIVRQMNDLARPASALRAKCDLGQIVRRAVEMVRHDPRAKGADIEYAFAPSLPPVHVAEDELTQVCVNLALNAFDAMAKNPPDRPGRLAIHADADATGVRVTFHDNGHGVPAAARPRLFQPFFSTKEVGRGTGLGLSVSFRILQEHGGTLALDESVTDGAAFTFTLPAGAAR